LPLHGVISQKIERTLHHRYESLKSYIVYHVMLKVISATKRSSVNRIEAYVSRVYALKIAE
jgi:hypothetical protein